MNFLNVLEVFFENELKTTKKVTFTAVEFAKKIRFYRDTLNIAPCDFPKKKFEFFALTKLALAEKIGVIITRKVYPFLITFRKIG